MKLEKQLGGINQAAVLLHNDCLYLFEEILGLAFEVWTDVFLSLIEKPTFSS